MSASTSAQTQAPAEKVTRFLRNALCGLLVICVLLMGVSLVGRIGSMPMILMAVTVVSSVLLQVTCFGAERRTDAALTAALLWGMFVLTVYLAIWACTGEGGSSGLKSFLLLLVIFPPTVSALRQAGMFKTLLRMYVRATAFLALTSTVLWVLGPELGLIQPNCQIANTWNLDNQVIGFYPGYFCLLYRTQWQAVGTVSIVRNTGIYGEAPVYVYVLLIALMLEMFVSPSRGKHHQSTAVILTLAIITTFSTTGYIFLLGIYYAAIYKGTASKYRASRRKRTEIFIIALAGAFALAIIASQMLDTKTSSSSGGIHVDDYIACLGAWADSPVFGIGFSNDNGLVEYMSGFRLDNTGHSNTLFYILATGGLLYLSLWLTALIGLFKNDRSRVFGALYTLLIAVTAADTLFLTAFVLSVGVSLLSDRIGEAAAIKTSHGSMYESHPIHFSAKYFYMRG